MSCSKVEKIILKKKVKVVLKVSKRTSISVEIDEGLARLWWNYEANRLLRERLTEEEIEKCSHKRNEKVAGCLFCFSLSFASHERSDYWSEENKLGPEKVSLNSNVKFFFNCDKCPHTFEQKPGEINKKQRWCSYCSHSKLCENEDCSYCENNSFASHIMSEKWNYIRNSNISPRNVFKNSNKKFWFDCEKCPHSFDIRLSDVNGKGQRCPFCANQKLCDDECNICYEKSFAPHERAEYWDKERNKILPRNCFKNSGKKCWFLCRECDHPFDMRLADISSGSCWCPYCSGQRRCEGGDCVHCSAKTFASHERAQCWDYKKNETRPEEFSKLSHIKAYFVCDKCEHSFDMRIAHVTNGSWCGYCSGKKLCINDCGICYNKSFASFFLSKYWNTDKNTSTPRQLSKGSQIGIYMNCYKCTHIFISTPYNIVMGHWCKFCRGHVCGEESCTICAKVCESCLTKKAQKKTRKKGHNLCRDCFYRCIKEDPEEAPLQNRSRLTLEIYTLAELQRGALKEENSFLIYEPTAWDCPILPGTNRKPDNIWCVDNNNNILTVSGACKINTGEISYVLILEILEHSIEHHSNTRSISDREREMEIRDVFYPIPVGVVYLTIAHTQHHGADRDDIFFEKGKSGEYEVLDNKREDWKDRINRTRDKLVQYYQNKSNRTAWIGS